MSNDSDFGRPKILVVDDVPANIGVLRDALEGEGYRIAVARDGKGALHAAVSAAPDLILLDVMMPEMDGYETCRRLKAEAATREIPVIFITARDEEESLLAGFGAGGVDYIVKPFKKEEVLIRVQTRLEISRLNRELRQKNQELAQANEEFRQEMARRQEAERARQRAEDLPVLAAHFLGMFAAEMGLPSPELSAPARTLLQGYAFPGNVRELKNIIEYALIKSEGATIGPEHLHFLELPSGPSPVQAPARPSEEERILGHVRQQGSIGNEECRQLLGVDRSRATYLLDKLCEVGRLSREGSRRWTRYRLP